MTRQRYRTMWFVATRRAHNRWLDLRGRLAGYCMATTWRADTDRGPSYAPGYSHWRCWKKRHQATELHRFINYVWCDDPITASAAPSSGLANYAPPPIDTPPDEAGNPPPWGKHHGIGTRRHDRQEARYLRAHGLSKRGAS